MVDPLYEERENSEREQEKRGRGRGRREKEREREEGGREGGRLREKSKTGTWFLQRRLSTY